MTGCVKGYGLAPSADFLVNHDCIVLLLIGGRVGTVLVSGPENYISKMGKKNRSEA